LIIPDAYEPLLDVLDTERMIKYIKDKFQLDLAAALDLTRVSAPIAVMSGTGLNDNLSGIELPVSFVAKDVGNSIEIVQSLAKWKRMALAQYGLRHGEGIYTDMNALRPDETLDNLHSLYVDQWDWERVIHADERNLEFLRWVVRRIYGAIQECERGVCEASPRLPGPWLPDEITFIHSEDLQRQYPDLAPKAREDRICAEHGAVFVIGIGAELADGRPHDQRAPDYDDWSSETGEGRRGLNGDILVWYPVLGRGLELSSMGIRVDRAALLRQLRLSAEEERLELAFHRLLLADELPLSVGGGIGQSRLCMYFMRKAHVGEVQSSVWPPDMLASCKQGGVPLL
jgi:aspartate--ammonia ligase